MRVEWSNMELDTKPASDYPMPDLLRLVNLSFENYIVPIHFNLSQFMEMIRKDSIDLVLSRVLTVDDQPAGVALIARRGWTCRLAAMGIVKELRGQRFGSWLMGKLIEEARERNGREMVLEVIEKNESAVRLYEKHGFQKVRRLIGLTNQDAKDDARTELQEIDLREMGRLILQHGLPDLPWQLSGETIALLGPPARAYQSGQAYVAISDPSAEHVVIWSLLFDADSRGSDHALELLKKVMANLPGKTWHVPAIWPEEFGVIFEQAGFHHEEISQWQMKLVL